MRESIIRWFDLLDGWEILHTLSFRPLLLLLLAAGSCCWRLGSRSQYVIKWPLQSSDERGIFTMFVVLSLDGY